MTHRYLHREIREKGGAYDGGAVLLSTYGTFAFHSYRDPTALNSLDVFQAAIDWAYGRSFTDAVGLFCKYI
jgi:Zn-dependent M16 (insulinase) family peptidase